MPPYVPKLLGTPRFCSRYVVRDRSRRPGDWYWTGRGWSRRLAQALLFDNMNEVNRTIARLYADMLR